MLVPPPIRDASPVMAGRNKNNAQVFSTLQKVLSPQKSTDEIRRSTQGSAMRLREALGNIESAEKVPRRGVHGVSQSMTIQPSDLRVSIDNSNYKSKESLHDSIGHDEPTLGTIQVEYNGMERTAEKGSEGVGRAMSMVSFDTIGSQYTVPGVDHKYHIKHGLKFGTKERSLKDKSYMSLVVDRAKKSVDPRKYAPQADWKLESMQRPNVALNRAKKITFLEEL